MNHYERSNWKFDGAVAPIFDQHVRQSIPAYEWIQKSVVHLTDFFCPENATVVDLGSATGETLQLIRNRHPKKTMKLIGVDESREMVTTAMTKVKGDTRYQWVPEQIQAYRIPEKTDLVLSILTLQFMEPEEREQVVAGIYSALKRGGAFVLVEKTYAHSGRIQDVFNQIYHDQKETAGFSTEEIRRKDESIRGVMTPLTQAENEAMLKRCGFEQTEMFFKDFHFSGWLAIK